MAQEKKLTTGEHNKVNRPKQNGYEIVLNSQDDQSVLNSHGDKLKQIWVRFGTLDDKKNHKWDRTVAIEPIVINPGEKKVVAMVDDDQLPAPADSCYYQLLCEIGEHDDLETLMTDPKLLK